MFHIFLMQKVYILMHYKRLLYLVGPITAPDSMFVYRPHCIAGIICYCVNDRCISRSPNHPAFGLLAESL